MCSYDCVFLYMCVLSSGLRHIVFLCEAVRICRDELHCWHKLLGCLSTGHLPLILIDLILSYNEFLCLRVSGGPWSGEESEREKCAVRVVVRFQIFTEVQSYQVVIWQQIIFMRWCSFVRKTSFYSVSETISHTTGYCIGKWKRLYQYVQKYDLFK